MTDTTEHTGKPLELAEVTDIMTGHTGAPTDARDAALREAAEKAMAEVRFWRDAESKDRRNRRAIMANQCAARAMTAEVISKNILALIKEPTDV